MKTACNHIESTNCAGHLLPLHAIGKDMRQASFVIQPKPGMDLWMIKVGIQ